MKPQTYTQNIYDRWLLFLCKAYVFAVPIAFIIAQYLANLYDRKYPPVHPTTYFEDQLAQRIIGKEVVERLCIIKYGYVFCLVVFVFYAIKARNDGDRTAFGNAMVFLLVTIISIIFF